MCLDEKTYERYRYLTIYAGIEKNKLNTYLKKGKNQNIINNRKLLIKNLNEELQTIKDSIDKEQYSKEYQRKYQRYVLGKQERQKRYKTLKKLWNQGEFIYPFEAKIIIQNTHSEKNKQIMQDYIDNYVSENYIKKDRKSAKEINGIEQHYDFIV